MAGNTSNPKHRDVRRGGNSLAGDEAGGAALRESSSAMMTFQEAETQNKSPHFSLAEVEAIKKSGAALTEGEWILPKGSVVGWGSF